MLCTAYYNPSSRLYELTEQFALEFPTLSPLPILLGALSVSHRTFASIIAPSTPTAVAKSSPAVESYTSSPQRSDFFRVLIWMLTHDLLVMLHVRVRIYIPRDIKVAALATRRAEKESRAKRMTRRAEALNGSGSDPKKGSVANSGPSPILKVNSASSIRAPSLHRASLSRSHSPTASRSNEPAQSLSKFGSSARHTRHKHAVSFDKVVNVEQPPVGSAPSSHGESSESTLNDENENGEQEEDDSDAVDAVDANKDNGQARNGNTSSSSGNHDSGRRPKQSSELETSELEEEEDTDLTPSFLNDPARATRGQRRWLDEICRGNNQVMVKGFRRSAVSRS